MEEKLLLNSFSPLHATGPPFSRRFLLDGNRVTYINQRLAEPLGWMSGGVG